MSKSPEAPNPPLPPSLITVSQDKHQRLHSNQLHSWETVSIAFSTESGSIVELLEEYKLARFLVHAKASRRVWKPVKLREELF